MTSEQRIGSLQCIQPDSTLGEGYERSADLREFLSGWPGPPQEGKSVEEVFSCFAPFGGYNGRMEWARFSREQGEILVVWEFYRYSGSALGDCHCLPAR